MRVVQAPEVYDKSGFELACFLAGGCSSTDWSERVLKYLNKYTLNHLVVYNPYNPNIESQFKQIEWEFNYLNNYINDHFIFSVYFDKYTDQPISMYELGRASVLSKPVSVSISCTDDPYRSRSDRFSYYVNHGFPIIVSVHPEAPKKQDIICQCGLAKVEVKERTPEEHAKEIIFWYNDFKRQMGV